MPSTARPDTDPTVPRRGDPHGRDGDYSGQEAGSFASPAPDHVAAGGVDGGTGTTPRTGAGQEAEDLPPEAGHRATVDQRTGAVHGSGAGTGGGQPDEDPDSDSGGSNTG